MQKQRRICFEFSLFAPFIVFSFLSMISCFSYALYGYSTIQSCTRFLRERVAVNMQVTVFNLARLKIVSTVKNLICRCYLYDYEM